MVLTYPDYGTYQSTVISPEGDLGEIAARLGGPKFRREGRILSYADFSPGLDGWKMSTPGVTIWNEYGQSFVGASSIRATGSPPAAPYIKRWVPLTQSRRVGFEFCFYSEVQNNLIYPEIAFLNGAQGYFATLLISCLTGNIYYYAPGGGWALLTNSSLIQVIQVWTNIKLVTDGDATPPSYVRLYINNLEIPINQPALPTPVVPSELFVCVPKVTAASADGTNPFDVYWDAAVITTNER